MTRTDTEEYHQIQHFQVGDVVTVTAPPESISTRHDDLLYNATVFYQPSTGVKQLAFNRDMYAMNGTNCLIGDVQQRPYGFVYYLQDINTHYEISYTYTAYFLSHANYDSNSKAASLLSLSPTER